MHQWILLAIHIVTMLTKAITSGKDLSPLLKKRLNRLLYKNRELKKVAVDRGCESAEGVAWEDEEGWRI